jgi:hypothetical protein
VHIELADDGAGIDWKKFEDSQDRAIGRRMSRTSQALRRID